MSVMPEHTRIEELRGTFLFEEFNETQLEWVIVHSDVRHYAAGEYAFQQTMPTDAFWVLLDGEIQHTRIVAGQEMVLEQADRPGTWGGWLPMFDKVGTVNLKIVTPSRLLRIHKHALQHMLDHGFPLTTHLLYGLYGGVQSVEALRWAGS